MILMVVRSATRPKWQKHIARTSYIKSETNVSGYKDYLANENRCLNTHIDGYLTTPTISGHQPVNVTEALTSTYKSNTENSEFITQKISVPGLHLGSAAQSSMILARARNKEALPAFSAICVYIQGKPAQSRLIMSSLFSENVLKQKKRRNFNFISLSAIKNIHILSR